MEPRYKTIAWRVAFWLVCGIAAKPARAIGFDPKTIIDELLRIAEPPRSKSKRSAKFARRKN